MDHILKHSRFTPTILFFLILLTLPQLCLAQDASCTIPYTGEQGLQGTGTDPYTGKPTCLAIDREPALYTGAFGDCLGSSEMEVTRFSAAYYVDNMTLTFELEGSTPLDNVETMLYISVYAYGENRFQYIWDPCAASSQTLCPTNNTKPFYSNLIIPLGQSDVAGIPSLAFSIPDFEGQAIMRIFSNSTQQEIACYSAVVTNGLTFAQPTIIGTVVGLFVIAALGASFITAFCGTDVVEARLHYAHSMSIWVIFAVFQHVFLTGALSVNWPSVLPAFWSNFAWASGMIYSPSMQDSLNFFSGNDYGNTTFVGAASTGPSSDNTGGGYPKGQIYSRAVRHLLREPARMQDAIRAVEEWKDPAVKALSRRADNSSDVFTWFGRPVTPGLPLPGNYSGFAGTLSLENIPASNAFMTGFLWLIILLVVLTAAAVALKWVLEGLVRANVIKQSRFMLFRIRWLRAARQIALRTCFAAFFLVMFLTMFEFSYHGASGPVAIAAFVFVLFFVGTIAIAVWAAWYRLKYGHFSRAPDKLHLIAVRAFPPLNLVTESARPEGATPTILLSMPWTRINYANDDPRRTDVHHDEDYIEGFGWLTARFRATEWWFFAFWLGYDFLRAIFLGGAAGHPQTQVFALLVIEFFAFCVMIKLKPFVSNRLNTLMIYLLGLSKILTTALASAFDPTFNLNRILTTGLGVVIIAIQSLLILAMLILIVIGQVSTYISLLRHREVFYPEHWRPAQRAYLKHLTGDTKPAEEPADSKTRAATDGKAGAQKPSFRVDSIRRIPKIEDSDQQSQDFDPFGSHTSLSGNAEPIGSVPPVPGSHTRRSSRALSTNSAQRNLPFGAFSPRTDSWSTADFNSWQGVDSRPASGTWHGHTSSIPEVPAIPAALHSRESLREISGAYSKEREGYKVPPSRVRTSTLRSVAGTESRHAAPTASKKVEKGEEYQLQVIKTRSARQSAVDPAPAVASTDLVAGAQSTPRTVAFADQQSPKPAGVAGAESASEPSAKAVRSEDEQATEAPDKEGATKEGEKKAPVVSTQEVLNEDKALGHDETADEGAKQVTVDA